MPKVNYIRKKIISESTPHSTNTKISQPSQNKISKPSNTVKISQDNCKGCKLCIAFCPRGMLSVAPHLNKIGFYPAVFNHKNKDKCSGCRFCVIVCPEGCLEVFKDE